MASLDNQISVNITRTGGVDNLSTITLRWTNFNAARYEVCLCRNYDSGLVRSESTMLVEASFTDVDLSDSHYCSVTPLSSDGRKISRTLFSTIHSGQRTLHIIRCSWSTDSVDFKWIGLENTVHYSLHVKDECLQKNILHETNLTGCAFTAGKNGDLRIGKSYMVKVTAIESNGRERSTEWSLQRIGDENVPRNVSAQINNHPSGRWVNIMFDNPPCSETPTGYEVVAVPRNGTRKIMTFGPAAPIVFKYAKRGAVYYFVVHAIYIDGTTSEGSVSNYFDTPNLNMRSAEAMRNEFHFLNCNVNIEIHGQAEQVNSQPPLQLGEVTGLEPRITDDSEECETYDLIWKAPTFGGQSDDYRIVQYKVMFFRGEELRLEEVVESSEKKDFTLRGIPLQIGHTYLVKVMTDYESIDEDRMLEANAETSITTRPCEARLQKSEWTDNTLHLGWSEALGAEGYRVEISRNGDLVQQSEGLSVTRYQWEAERHFFGENYSIRIIAFSQEGKKESSTESNFLSVGGPLVPRKVSASRGGESGDLKQAIVHWNEPEIKRNLISYEVIAIERDSNRIVKKEACKDVSKTECMVEGLETGLWYLFEVTAWYQNGDVSSRSSSEPLQMDPLPNKVKNVKVTPDLQQPAFRVAWRGGGKFAYVVAVESKNPPELLERETSQPFAKWTGLRPGSEYHVRVKAKNASGCGQWSQAYVVTTAHEGPTRLITTDSLDSTLCVLSFIKASDNPVEYELRIFEEDRVQGKFVMEVGKIEDGKGQGGPNEVTDSNISCQFTNKNDRECSIHIAGLTSNSGYTCELKAHYGDAHPNDHIERVAFMTAPGKDQKPIVKVVRQGDWYSSKVITIKLESRKCHIHKIEVRKIGGCLKSQFIIDKEEWNYTCSHKSASYAIRVQSQNSSGKYGEWSDEVEVNLDEEMATPLLKSEPTLKSNPHSQLQPQNYVDVTDKNGPAQHKIDANIVYKKSFKPPKLVYEGLMQTVHSELTSESRIAVKFILLKDIDDGDKQEREHRHLMELQHHPNVVKYIHHGRHELTGHGKSIFIAMELCDENSLQSRMEAKGLEFDDDDYCKCLSLHIAHGLLHIHENGIVHRDIKPHNILFSLDGKTAKISDFGFSKKIRIGKDATSVSSNAKGTDGWRSPETYKARSARKATFKSDVFSFGLIQHYILSKGQHAFGADDTQWSPNICNGKDKWTGGLTVANSSIAQDLIDKALEHEEKDRPSVKEILKHPYFWSLDAITGFYERVDDLLGDTFKQMKLDTTEVDQKPPVVNGQDLKVDQKPLVVNGQDLWGEIIVESHAEISKITVFPGERISHDQFLNSVDSRNKLKQLQDQIEDMTLYSKKVKPLDFFATCVELYVTHNRRTYISTYSQPDTERSTRIDSKEWIRNVLWLFTSRFKEEAIDMKPAPLIELRTPRPLTNEQQLLEDINELKLRRKYSRWHEWNAWLLDCAELCIDLCAAENQMLHIQHIHKLEKGDNPVLWIKKCMQVLAEEEMEKRVLSTKSDDLETISSKAGTLKKKESEGLVISWKSCLELEARRCSNDHTHKTFVANSAGCDDTIYGLVRYVRNGFVHFEEKKKANDGKWWTSKAEMREFVASAVPELFPHVYNIMKEDLADYIDENKQKNWNYNFPEVL